MDLGIMVEIPFISWIDCFDKFRGARNVDHFKQIAKRVYIKYGAAMASDYKTRKIIIPQSELKLL